MPLTSLSPALTLAQSFSPINSWVSRESITLASWPCFVDQRYPQTPHSHTTPIHISLSHTLLKLFISVDDFPKKRSLFLRIFWSQAAKCCPNIYWAPLCFQAHVSYQERHGGSHGPCTNHSLMSNDITTSKEALSKKVQELPCKTRSMLYVWLCCCHLWAVVIYVSMSGAPRLCARNGTRLWWEGFHWK